LSTRANGKSRRHLGLDHSQVGSFRAEFLNTRMFIELKLR